MADESLPAMFFDRVRRRGDEPAYRYRDDAGTYVDMSFREAGERVEALAAGFLALTGFGPGTCVTILADTRLEWILCDFALLSLGLRTCPVYASLLPAEVGYIHQDLGARAAIVENKAQLEKLRAAKRGFSFFGETYAPSCLALEHVFVIDPAWLEPADDWRALADVEAAGRERLASTRTEREARLAALRREEIATYCYTSGTTGPPKGVLQTHDNVLSLLENTDDVGMFAPPVPEHGVFLFLPLAHSFGRLMEFGSSFHGAVLVLSSLATLQRDLVETRPGFLPSAPRMYEKIHTRVLSTVEDATAARRRLFRWALGVGRARLPYWQARRPMPLWLRLQHRLADRLVFSKLRARLGLDRMVCMLSGSAPLSREVAEFFAALGVLVLEAYGLTETSPGISANRLHDWKLGTVGKRIRGVELKLADDGEICVRGPNITPGYHNRPEATSGAFDDEGWFRTGDIGELDADGFLRITDRKKDLIKTSGGKYIAPQKIEGRLKNHPLLSEAIVIGEGRNYCTALVVLDQEAARAWAARTGQGAAPDCPALRDEIAGYIEELNRELASFETIKKFHVIGDELSVETGLLTASLKVKRKEVNERYRDAIEALYRPTASS